ncbi:MAG: indolepyruvate oxidoreductase subunit beta [Deltaproteobacteria bacterium]|nr:indolepyruvate oxidoreductase subunit beta [Deltaproteobacteria bacterium]
MKFDIIIAGVGGQGILSVAFILDNACMQRGIHIKQAEVHGMAQRGGAVQSHLRMSDQPVLSDLVPRGAADLILSVEPLEVNRYLAWLAPGGLVLSNAEPEVNIPDYPPLEAVHAHVLGLPRGLLVDAKAVARAAGNVRAQNMVLTGAASPFLPFFTPEDLEAQVEALFTSKGEKMLALNLAAFRMGRELGLLSKGLLERGIPATRIFALTRQLQPATMSGDHAAGWAEALAAGTADARLAALEAPIPSGPEGQALLRG